MAKDALGGYSCGIASQLVIVSQIWSIVIGAMNIVVIEDSALVTITGHCTNSRNLWCNANNRGRSRLDNSCLWANLSDDLS